MKKVKVDSGRVTFGSAFWKYGVYEWKWFRWVHVKGFDDILIAKNYAETLVGLPYTVVSKT